MFVVHSASQFSVALLTTKNLHKIASEQLPNKPCVQHIPSLSIFDTHHTHADVYFHATFRHENGLFMSGDMIRVIEEDFVTIPPAFEFLFVRALEPIIDMFSLVC